MKLPHRILLSSCVGSLLFVPILGAYNSSNFFKPEQILSIFLGQASSSEQASQNHPQEIARAITVQVSAENQLGSGTLIGKEDNTYQVLTNAHLFTNQESPYQVQTPDGEVYEATLISQGDSLEGKDVALLEFESSHDYTIAQIGNRLSLNKQDSVLAAGFSIEQEEMILREGEITHLPEDPLKGGYQIGYTNDIEQGMSGGPLLNEAGEVIGINGLGKAAIVNEAYTFEDGSSPSESQIKEFRQASWSIPFEVSSLAKIDPKLATQQVNQIAETITVRIDAEEGNGSGVIVAQEEDSYWVLTAEHVVSKEGNYQVVTPDGKEHTVDYETVKSPEGVDLALLQFRSSETYPVATLGDYSLSNNPRNRPLVFLSGFPGSNPEKRSFTAGNTYPQVAKSLQVKNQSSLSSGYGLVYTNFSQKGMSGGPVLDSWGRVIGINTASEAEFEITEAGEVTTINLGKSLGVPIRTFLGFVPKTAVETEALKLATSKPPELSESKVEAIKEGLFQAKAPTGEGTAIEWLNYGNRLWRIGKDEKAIRAFEQAIQLQSDFYQAYYAKGQAFVAQAYDDLQKEGTNEQAIQEKFEEAFTAFEEATSINPNFYEAWRDRAVVLSELERNQEALTSINKAIDINPEDFILHYERGWILSNLGRLEAAEQAYNEAISLNPSAWTYHYRGMARAQLQNYQGAIADFNKAIDFHPNFASAYRTLGSTLASIGKEQEALANVNKAMELKPDHPENYLVRALIHMGSENYQQAITDLNKAIELNPIFEGIKYSTYIQRALAYKRLEDYQAAINDVEKAIELQPQEPLAYYTRANVHSNQKNYERAISDYNKVIELQSDNADAYKRRGFAYAELGKREKAALDYKQALELYNQRIEDNPDDASAYVSRAELRVKLHGKFQIEEEKNVIQAAIQDLEKAAELFRKQGNQRGYQTVQEMLSLLEEIEEKT